jgi:hypothetical protein
MNEECHVELQPPARSSSYQELLEGPAWWLSGMVTGGVGWSPVLMSGLGSRKPAHARSTRLALADWRLRPNLTYFWRFSPTQDYLFAQFVPFVGCAILPARSLHHKTVGSLDGLLRATPFWRRCFCRPAIDQMAQLKPSRATTQRHQRLASSIQKCLHVPASHAAISVHLA